MTEKEIENSLRCCIENECANCSYYNPKEQYSYHCERLKEDILKYITDLKSEKQCAETQLTELLSAWYQRTDSEQGFTLYRKDIVELANDYGIKEEELNERNQAQ